MRTITVLAALLLVLAMSGISYANVITYKHIRNATARIEYAGSIFLVDPFLADKGAYPGFEGTPNSDRRIPLIDMAESAEEVVRGIDAVILTHTHLDHWDEAAVRVLPKDIPFFVQNAGDARIIRELGFSNVMVAGKNTPFRNVRISRTAGQHGPDALYSIPARAEFAGDAMGFTLKADGLKTLYVVGDTTWHPYVEVSLKMYSPDVIVMNTGYAMVNGIEGSLIMGKDDILHMYNFMPEAEIIAVHMDAVNHTVQGSDEIRKFVDEHGMTDRVYVPREGETLKF